jgi:DNA repair protein RadC
MGMQSVQISNEAERYIIRDTNILMHGFTEYDLQVKDLPEEERPREKLLSLGPKSLNLAELMAILLGTGTKREEVLTMSQRIIKEYGEKAIINELDARRLANALDIPLVKSAQIVAAFELGRRFFSQKAGKPVFIRNSTQAYEHLKDMAHARKEQLRGLYLNSRHELIHDEVLSVGSLTANIVHPREVFQPAITHSAVAVIIAHNHPSGDPTPTPPDLAVTEQLRKAGETLGISLLDHIIITPESYESIILKEHLL